VCVCALEWLSRRNQSQRRNTKYRQFEWLLEELRRTGKFTRRQYFRGKVKGKQAQFTCGYSLGGSP
jgi:hypothetical protein